MALNGWTKKCVITVASNKLAYTQTNQVVILNTAHFPTGMVTLNGADSCKSDGGDIRFSSDANGDTLLPFDIINISLNANPASSILVCAFKTNVTANASFTIYCHWGNASASKVATSDTVGSANCWSEVYGILYLQENPANASTTTAQWKFFKEATGRYSAASEIGTCQQVAGPITGMNAVAINASNGVRIPEVVATGPSDTFTVAAFIRPVGTTYPGTAINDYSGAVFFSGASEMLIGWSTAGECKWQYAGGYANPQFGVGKGNKWRLWVTQVSGNSALYYLDPTQSAFTVGSITSLTNLQYLGGADTGGTVKAGAYHICMFMIGKFALPNMNWFRNLQNNFDNITTLATAGSIQTSSVSASLTLTGLIDGTEVRIYNGSTEVAGVESSTGGTFTYNYSTNFTATIVIHNLLEQYIRYGSVSLTSSGATIPIQQIDDIWYTSSFPANLNATNVTINTGVSPKTITVAVDAKLKDLYSYLKQLWKSDANLIKEIFPLTPITDEMFIMNAPWNFANASTINRIKDAGWSRRDASNAVLEEYMNVTTLGTLSGTPYYVQATGYTATTTNAVATGAMNQAVKIYGNASNGNFDYRTTFFKVFTRTLGNTYSDYDLLSLQSITALTFRKYSIPLSNTTDLKQLTTNTTTLTTAPYNTITLTRYTENIRGAWVASTSYAVGDVVRNPSNRWVRCSTAHTSGATYSSTNWASYAGERLIGTTYYAFRYIINGGGLSLQQVYTRINYELSLTANIVDTGSAMNGNLAPLFLSYLGDTMQTDRGVFIDNFLASDINRVEFFDYNNTKATFPLTVNFILTGLQVNTEVRVYRSSDMVELAGVENSTTSFTYSYEYSADIPIIVRILNTQYVPISITTTLTNQSTAIPIQQNFDRTML